MARKLTGRAAPAAKGPVHVRLRPTSSQVNSPAAAWADARSGDADILLSVSRDGGQTWSSARRINDDPLANGIDQIQPQLAAGPDGRLVVAWLDRRNYCPDLRFIPREHVGKEDFCLDVYLSRSLDDGASFTPNLRVSAQTWDWTLSLWGRDRNRVDGRYRYPYRAGEGREDVLSDAGCARVLRGGSWDDAQYDARAACRFNAHPAARRDDVGFRVVRASPNSPGL